MFVVKQDVILPGSARFLAFSHTQSYYSFGVQTWIGNCCGLNAIQQIALSTLNAHHEEIFLWLSDLPKNLSDLGVPILTWPTKKFIYLNAHWKMSDAPNFLQHRCVERVHQFPNLAHSEHDIDLYFINLEKL